MNSISAPGAKGSQTPGATLMCDTFMHGSICQKAKADREHADQRFISSDNRPGLCLTIEMLTS